MSKWDMHVHPFSPPCLPIYLPSHDLTLLAAPFSQVLARTCLERFADQDKCHGLPLASALALGCAPATRSVPLSIRLGLQSLTHVLHYQEHRPDEDCAVKQLQGERHGAHHCPTRSGQPPPVRTAP